MTDRKAVFLDRDGVINVLVPDPQTGLPESPLDPRDVELLPGVAPAIRRLGDEGFLVVGVSNQPAAAKGKVGLAEIEAVQRRVLVLLAEQDATFDGFQVCLHHPEGIDPNLARACDCRKPAPGMLRDAARTLGINLGASWVIGDSDADVLAGAAAGCRTIVVQNPDSAHRRSGQTPPTAQAPDLPSAVAQLLDTYSH